MISPLPSAVFDTSSALNVVNRFEHAVVTGGSSETAAAAYAIYAAQTDRRIVLRELTVSNPTAVAITVVFSKSGGGTLMTLTIPAGVTQQFVGYMSSESGATINRTLTVSDFGGFTVSVGYGIEIHAG